MKLTNEQLWHRFRSYYSQFSSLGLAIDLSRINFPDNYLDSMDSRMKSTFAAMIDLERGSIANPDENRMVGHYWLRTPALAPSPEIRREIEQTLSDIKSFAAQVHGGVIRGAGGPFVNLLVIGIGGSALGPQFVSRALGQTKTDRMSACFLDNTDPDGFDMVFSRIKGELGQTLCLVISKSGGTKETRNGMLEAQEIYRRSGVDFASQAVAITGVGSELDRYAQKSGWIRRFPMWDWVGGRTSELSAVGLLPAALQGIEIEELLSGAQICDQITRIVSVKDNPAAQLALAWYFVGNGKGDKAMVILPYKDRLELFSSYLQQLVMESLGKEFDLDGRIVNQGIAVYGNKGSTDQHAYVQQLRDGPNNFFVTFIEILKERDDGQFFVEPSITSGDYLQGFLLGTRRALYEKNRESITITLRDVSAFSLGVLIALYERAVGYYASLININAYHQPGVEAGKKAASDVIDLMIKVLDYLSIEGSQPQTISEITERITKEGDLETVFRICEHLAANPARGIIKIPGSDHFSAKYTKA